MLKRLIPLILAAALICLPAGSAFAAQEGILTSGEDSTATNAGNSEPRSATKPGAAAHVGEAYNHQYLVFADEGHARHVSVVTTYRAPNLDSEKTINGLPCGLSMDNNGIIKGTPTAAASGTMDITVTWDGSSKVDTYRGLPFSIFDPNTNGWFNMVEGQYRINTASASIKNASIGTDYSNLTEGAIYRFTPCDYDLFIVKSGMVPQLYDKNGLVVESTILNNLNVSSQYFFVTPGDTYYLKVTYAVPGAYFSIAPPDVPEMSSLASDVTPRLIASNVSKTFSDDSNTTWDVYAIEEVVPYDYLGWARFRSGYACVTPYKTHFLNWSVNAAGSYKKTYSDYSTIAPWKYLNDNPTPSDQQLSSIVFYSYFSHWEGKSELVTYYTELYVPAGKKIALDEKGRYCDSTDPEPNYDVNDNGVINIVDAQVVYDVACNKYTGTQHAALRSRCDINGDGTVDAQDALRIQYLALHG